jgi:hypothetical protein
MLCDQCGLVEATVHITRFEPGNPKLEHLCEPCASRRKWQGVPLFSSNETLQKQGWISVTGYILRIEPDAVALRVLRSSKFYSGQELRLRGQIVPDELRVPGTEFSFCCVPESVGVLVIPIDA